MELIKISEITRRLAIPDEYVYPYGPYKAKIDLNYAKIIENRPTGKLVLVTAMTPSRAGEGKTTMAIALSDGLNLIGKKSIVALREPSLGPVFGLKGGATGGGKVTVEPEEDINLHFTGDIHALTSANNLISAIIDNHIFQGNELKIDPEKIKWKRTMDMNDRSLRQIKIGLGENNGTIRDDGFMITVASELMAILCLATSKEDFENRIKKIIVAYSFDDRPITVGQLHISHAIMKLMKSAFNPNIVQTQANNPALIHGGPFANIAHGCSSIFATKMGLKLGEIVVTEAGFATELGAEKFFDIKSRVAGLTPDAAVVIVTVKAIKLHGGVSLDNINIPNLEAIKIGFENVLKHLENIRHFKVPSLIGINKFATDTQEELDLVLSLAQKSGVKGAIINAFSLGGDGARDMALKVVEVLETRKSHYTPLYDLTLPVQDKIKIIAQKMYGAKEVVYTKKALLDIEKYVNLGYNNNYICMAKTPQSLSDDPTKLNVPKDFTLTVREVNLSAGAEFLVVLTGDIMTMPGLGKTPNAVLMQDIPWE